MPGGDTRSGWGGDRRGGGGDRATGGDDASGTVAIRRRGNFDPERHATDMRFVVDVNPFKQSQELQVRDIGMFPNIFSQPGDDDIYEKLVDEISAVAVDEGTAVLRPWHGDTHWVVDDTTGWKRASPTYQAVVERVKKYFGMNVNSTRLNWFRDGNEYKPFHHDSAAISADKAEFQNFSVGISFGATRELAFEDVETRRVISMPLPDGSVYCIGRDANIIWRHGVLQQRSAAVVEEGRISIVIWGWRDQTETVAPPRRLRVIPSATGGPARTAPGRPTSGGSPDGHRAGSE